MASVAIPVGSIPCSNFFAIYAKKSNARKIPTYNVGMGRWSPDNRRDKMTLYHGDYGSDISAHEGMCFTDSADDAEGFGRFVFSCSLDLRSMTVETCGAYDHDTDDAPADCAKFRAAAAARGVDVLRYDDEDERGRSIVCYRLVSARAVAACHLTLVD